MNATCDCYYSRDNDSRHYCGQLRYAIRSKKYDLLKLLLLRSTRPNRAEHVNQTFERVCKIRDLVAIEIMLDHGIQFDDSNDALFYKAIDKDDKELLQLIMSYEPHAEPILQNVIRHNLVAECGRGFLKLFTEDSHARRVLKLMHRLNTCSRADRYITKDENKELTPLHYCLKYCIRHSGDYDKIKWLMQMKADVNAADHTGDTPLMVAIRNAPDDVVSMLIDAKADVNARDNNGNTALCMLNSNNIHSHITRMRLLLDSKADPNIVGTTTPLTIMVNAPICDWHMEYLLEAKADVNVASTDGTTPMKALTTILQSCKKYADTNYTTLALALIDAKADVGALDAKSKTMMLNECVERNDTTSMRALLNAVKQANRV